MARPTALNFGRYLNRLGLKQTDQPPILHSVQPVSLVADHSQLVSPALDIAGVIGGTQPLQVGELSAFVFASSVPTWIYPHLSTSAAVDIAVELSILAARPILNGPVDLFPQLFSQPLNQVPKIIGLKGSRAAAVDPTKALFRMPNGDGFGATDRFLIPAGGWIMFQSTAAVILSCGCLFYEMPNENAQ